MSKTKWTLDLAGNSSWLKYVNDIDVDEKNHTMTFFYDAGKVATLAHAINYREGSAKLRSSQMPATRPKKSATFITDSFSFTQEFYDYALSQGAKTTPTLTREFQISATQIKHPFNPKSKLVFGMLIPDLSSSAGQSDKPMQPGNDEDEGTWGGGVKD